MPQLPWWMSREPKPEPTPSPKSERPLPFWMEAKGGDFNASHPRFPSGTSQGGQFAPKNGQGSAIHPKVAAAKDKLTAAQAEFDAIKKNGGPKHPKYDSAASKVSKSKLALKQAEEAFGQQAEAKVGKVESPKFESDFGLPVIEDTGHNAGGAPDFAQLTKVGGQKGSNEGGLYEDPSGQKWYVKTPKEAGQAHSEVLAGALYRTAGVNVPETYVISGPDGKPSVASKYSEGLQQAGVSTLKNLGRQDFATHAVLANWDAVGTGKDNLLVTTDNKLMMVDAGGSLMYRAQGGKKDFKPGMPAEWDSMRDPSKGKDASDVFGGMTDAQLASSAAKVSQLTDERIVSLVGKHMGHMSDAEQNDLSATVMQRRDAVLAKGRQLEATAKPKVEEHPLQTDTTPKPAMADVSAAQANFATATPAAQSAASSQAKSAIQAQADALKAKHLALQADFDKVKASHPTSSSEYKNAASKASKSKAKWKEAEVEVGHAAQNVAHAEGNKPALHEAQKASFKAADEAAAAGSGLYGMPGAPAHGSQLKSYYKDALEQLGHGGKHADFENDGDGQVLKVDGAVVAHKTAKGQGPWIAGPNPGGKAHLDTPEPFNFFITGESLGVNTAHKVAAKLGYTEDELQFVLPAEAGTGGVMVSKATGKEVAHFDVASDDWKAGPKPVQAVAKEWKIGDPLEDAPAPKSTSFGHATGAPIKYVQPGQVLGENSLQAAEKLGVELYELKPSWSDDFKTSVMTDAAGKTVAWNDQVSNAWVAGPHPSEQGPAKVVKPALGQGLSIKPTSTYADVEQYEIDAVAAELGYGQGKLKNAQYGSVLHDEWGNVVAHKKSEGWVAGPVSEAQKTVGTLTGTLNFQGKPYMTTAKGSVLVGNKLGMANTTAKNFFPTAVVSKGLMTLPDGTVVAHKKNDTWYAGHPDGASKMKTDTAKPVPPKPGTPDGAWAYEIKPGTAAVPPKMNPAAAKVSALPVSYGGKKDGEIIGVKFASVQEHFKTAGIELDDSYNASVAYDKAGNTVAHKVAGGWKAGPGLNPTKKPSAMPTPYGSKPDWDPADYGNVIQKPETGWKDHLAVAAYKSNSSYSNKAVVEKVQQAAMQEVNLSQSSHQAYQAVNKHGKEFRSKLPSGQQEAIRSYHQSGYGPMNDVLRKEGGKTGPSGESSKIKNATSALEKASLPQEMVVLRGVSYSPAASLLEGPGVVGKTYYDPAFQSTSVNLSTAEGFGHLSTTSAKGDSYGGSEKRALLRLTVPKGAKALAANQEHPSEAEVLLQRNSAFRVDKVETLPNGLVIVHGTVRLDIGGQVGQYEEAANTLKNLFVGQRRVSPWYMETKASDTEPAQSIRSGGQPTPDELGFLFGDKFGAGKDALRELPGLEEKTLPFWMEGK